LSASNTEGVDTVSWKNGGTTNFRFKSGDGQGNRCPSRSSELVLKGKAEPVKQFETRSYEASFAISST
jgi:hypothetical protein